MGTHTCNPSTWENEAGSGVLWVETTFRAVVTTLQKGRKNKNINP